MTRYRLEYRGFLTHQRLLKRQADGAGDSESDTAELCPTITMTAAIAAASSSVGVGEMFMSDAHEAAAERAAERGTNREAAKGRSSTGNSTV